ncbi:MAG TPA: hypothetical protein VHV10_05640 [Ktedonobacteraceae bacterium]|nr:hypothetical protein [Ktedonobacteraceae bacterium]
MRPLPEYERLNDQLEKHLPGWQRKEQLDQSRPPVPTREHDPESEALVALARHLQAAPSLLVHPDFARRLEQRMLLHHVALRRQLPEGARHAAKTRGSWFFWRSFGASLALAVVLLCSLSGTSMLALAAQVTNPSNPLYTVKTWEQQVQLSLARSPSDQAEVSLHIARDRLNVLANAHGETYRQALADLDGQIEAVMQILNALPAGQDHKRLTDELATFKTSARRALRDGLSHHSLPERLVTTEELGHLGDAVTQLNHAAIIFSSHSPIQATISLAGNNFSAGGHVLIDQVFLADNGTLQNGTDVFVVNWNGEWSPHTIGILNTDGTVAQTTVILFPNAKENTNSKNTQTGNNKGNTSENTHTNNSSNGVNANKQDGNSQNGNTTSNGSNSHGHKNNEIQPSP